MNLLKGSFLSFDTETTGVDVDTDRIVTACAIEVGPDGATTRGSWLLNPGVEIPASATAIHGVTNEWAQRAGEEPEKALRQMAELLRGWWASNLPVIAMNASFDLTLLRNECARYGHSFDVSGPVIDPLVLDRATHPYRKGKRNLTALAECYGVKQDEAHTSKGDALTAARVVWAQLKRNPELANMDLATLHDFQRDAHRNWALNLETYLRSQGKSKAINVGWPIRRADAERSAA